MGSPSTDNPLSALDPHVADPLDELVQALAAIAWGPPPVIPVTEVPTPTPDGTVG